jgi:hypothetical protein
MLMAVGIFSLSGLVLMGLYLFCIRGMASMYNYAVLDQYNRHAMDTLTRELRQCKMVSNYTTNSISVLTANPDGSNGPTVTYSFNKTSQKLLRSSTDGTSEVLLNDCSLLQFDLRTRIPKGQSYESYPVATNNWQQTVKVLQLSWKTAIYLPNGVGNTENIQTARIVIRKQDDGV